MQDNIGDWNELRLILAVARAAGLTGAAKGLGIDHSTVFRRLQALEARLGLPIFERLPGGLYQPTAAGERMVAAAERMEDETLALARDIAGRDPRLSGRLRVTSSETLAYRMLTRQIGQFRCAHPGIVVELTVDNRMLSLSRREADIALRPVRPREGDLWGRRLAAVAWTVYGRRDNEAARAIAGPQDLAAHALIGWDEAVTGIGAADWLTAMAPPSAFVYRSGSLINQLVAAKSGIGLAALPCYLGDPEADLVRVLAEPVPALERELWIVTHSDLKRTARVRAFFELVGDSLIAERALLEGRRPAAG
jgi:DNA-binding transcriptional LysR family regulator